MCQIKSIRTSIKIVICSKIDPEFDGVLATDLLAIMSKFFIINIRYEYLNKIKEPGLYGSKCKFHKSCGRIWIYRSINEQ